MIGVLRNKAMRTARAEAGFSLLELALVTVIVVILMLLSLRQIHVYQGELEQAELMQTVATLRAGMNIRIANLLASDKRAEIVQMAGQNPVDWLEQKPKNYLGVFYAPKSQDLAEGNWYYDKNNKTLVYLLNNSKFPRGDPRKRLIFKVNLIHNSNGSQRKIDGINADEIDGVVLEQVNR